MYICNGGLQKKSNYSWWIILARCLPCNQILRLGSISRDNGSREQRLHMAQVHIYFFVVTAHWGSKEELLMGREARYLCSYYHSEMRCQQAPVAIREKGGVGS